MMTLFIYDIIQNYLQCKYNVSLAYTLRLTREIFTNIDTRYPTVPI